MKNKPKFYLKILNGYDMAFGICVYLDENMKYEIFSEFTTPEYDHRKNLFRKFVNNENLDLLDFCYTVFHRDMHINQRCPDGTFNVGTQDCRNWIHELNSMRKRVLDKKDEDIFPTSKGIVNYD